MTIKTKNMNQLQLARKEIKDNTLLIESHVIPPCTNELGKHFGMPKREDIVIDELYAYMTEITFNKLKEYSTSNPSGVYLGKMWKSRINISKEWGRIEWLKENSEDVWHLCWYGVATEKDYCNIYTRVITIKNVVL